ncbi:MAG: hypothetical protein Q9203_005123, partial [Teloschistes exilis]
MNGSLAMTKEQKRRFFAHREQFLILQRHGAPHPITLTLKPNYETNPSIPTLRFSLIPLPGQQLTSCTTGTHPRRSQPQTPHPQRPRVLLPFLAHEPQGAGVGSLRQLLEADEIVKRFEVAAKTASEGEASGKVTGTEKIGRKAIEGRVSKETEQEAAAYGLWMRSVRTAWAKTLGWKEPLHQLALES